MTKIKSLSMTSMRVEEDFGFQQLVLTNCEFLPQENEGEPDEGASPILTAAVENFTQCLNKFDEALKEATVLSGVKKAANCDAVRDRSWNNCDDYLEVMCNHPDPELAAIAQECKKEFDKYGNPVDLPQTQESGILHNLFQDIEKITTEKLEKIHFTAWFNNLKTSQQNFLDAVGERTAQEGLRQTGIIKETRTAADAAYRTLIDTVNLLAAMNGATPYATFINNLNALIDRQKTVLKTRSTNAKKKNETGSDKEEDDDNKKPSTKPDEPTTPVTPEEPTETTDPEDPTTGEGEEGGEETTDPSEGEEEEGTGAIPHP